MLNITSVQRILRNQVQYQSCTVEILHYKRKVLNSKKKHINIINKCTMVSKLKVYATDKLTYITLLDCWINAPDSLAEL